MPEFERKHLSVHIEKTAGTSLENFLVRYYGRKNVLVYSADTERLFRADNLVMLIRFNGTVNRLRSTRIVAAGSPFVHLVAMKLLFIEGGRNTAMCRLPENWSVVHGHFVADKFDTVLDNPFRTVIFRQPLERAISHYKYWKLARGILNQRIRIPYQPEMKFRDFALLEEMQNYQSKALGTVPIESFDVVGVTENFDRFVADFVRKRGKLDLTSLPKVAYLNRSFDQTGLNGFGVDGEFVKKFQSLNELDYKNWRKAREIDGSATP